jgi:beta-glucosidase
MQKLFVLILITALFSCNNSVNITDNDARLNKRVDSVLALMTLDEKIGQMVLLTSDWDITGPVMQTNNLELIRQGFCGNIFNAYTAKYTRELQKIAMEETRLKIPLLFGYDVIHGHKTIFPISLGESASWDLDAIERSARIGAIEAAVSGLHWTFAPMVDITIDPRWGRVSEGAGEDPFLGSRIAEARVRGIQGRFNNLADSLTVMACVKHFAAYGAPQGGRDYNTVDMSERQFRDIYLPPYVAALNAGARSVMTSFNELDGVPATASKWLMYDILRKELGFDGLLVTDYTAINELVPHGVAANEEDAAVLSLNATVDMDMQGSVYLKYLKNLVEKGIVKENQINDAVRRILKIKFELGLFDDPYRYCDEDREIRHTYNDDNLSAAHDMALKSMVLLKNNSSLLPLKKGEKLAVIGELAMSKRDLLGSWKAAGNWDTIHHIFHTVSALNGVEKTSYSEGCKKMGDDKSGFTSALKLASESDKVIMVLGEDFDWSGEAASRTSIKIPGVQTELLRRIKSNGKQVILVLLNGRPLDLSEESELADAILVAWFPGSKGAEAVADILFGNYNPSGKLPISFPRSIGQIPMAYYAKNTGRPFNPAIENDKYKSKYIDVPNDPLYPFGFGLSYTKFGYSDIILSNNVLTVETPIVAKIKVTNIGSIDGEETVQLYIRDVVGSVTRPIKELKGFEKVFLKSGESKIVEFSIEPQMLAFHTLSMEFKPEKGLFQLFIGSNSIDVKTTEFTLE